MYPYSRNVLRKTFMLGVLSSRVALSSTPIRQILSGCCACALIGSTAAALSAAMNSRRLMGLTSGQGSRTKYSRFWVSVACIAAKNAHLMSEYGIVRTCSRPCQRAKLARGHRKTKEHAMSEKLNSKLAVIGIDIGKNSFHIVGQDRRGALVLRQKWSRGQVEARLANLPPCLIGMEACTGAHHLSRKLQALGHNARLMPAKYVRPYCKGDKNDYRDAEAIAEAVQRPTMRFVATKTADQLDLQALHRVRERLVSQRTG